MLKGIRKSTVRPIEGYLAQAWASPDGSYKSMTNDSLIVRINFEPVGSYWIVEERQSAESYNDDDWETIAKCQTEYDAIGTMFCRMHRLCS